MAGASPSKTLKKRADFLRLARGKKIARPGFILQAAMGMPGEQLRAGYTATKKLGNAVARNRARRRLKEAARLTFAGRALEGLELVLVCRRETAALPFTMLRNNLAAALAEVPAAEWQAAQMPAAPMPAAEAQK